MTRRKGARGLHPWTTCRAPPWGASPMLPKTMVAEEVLSVPCPCGQTVIVLRNVKDGDKDFAKFAVLHPIPECDVFTRTDDPAEYLRIVRESLITTTPGGQPS